MLVFSQVKIFGACYRLLPAFPSRSLENSWPRTTLWRWQEGGHGRIGRETEKKPTSRLQARCGAPLQQLSEIRGYQGEEEVLDEELGILCEPCNGRGWLLCDFCKGQKTNVKAENRRIYRRCPSCRAVGYVLCSKCKVFKCVTFPDYDDGEM